MRLSDAIAQRQQNTENAFFTNLMQYGMNSSPMFDTSGAAPVYIGGASKMPSKTDLWNQYVQIKGGRLSPQDLAVFEQYYNNAVSAHNSNQLKGLQQLAMQGYSPKKIKKVVKDSPDLYNNLMDMVTTFENRGDEEGMVAGSQIRQYLPSTDKGIIGDDETSTLEKIIPPAALYAAYKGFQIDPETGKRRYKKATSKIPKSLRKYGSGPAGLLAYATAEPIGEYLGGEEGREMAGNVVSGLMTAQGARMVAQGLMKAPNPYAKVAGGLTLGGLGLYDLIWGE
tara:strand:- start:940 stop:1785 length:846 start_codon:yes stop_codon:yes gene_type:complete